MSPAALLAEAGLWERSSLGAAVALLLLLRWTLPEDRRRRLRLPLTFVFLSLLVLPARLLPGLGARQAQALRLAGEFFLVLALVHLVLLVVFEGTVLTRGRVPRIVQDVVIALVYFVAVMGLFGASGVELSSLLTTSALLTAVVGFALQDTLGNVVSGLAIQVKRPFTIGDWVSLDGRPENYGRVVEMNWRATRVITNENVMVIVPNANIAKGTVLNFSEPTPVVRRSVRVSVSYDVPPSRVEEIALRAMRASPGVLEEPPPECVLSEFGDSGIEYGCRFFIDDFRRRDVLAGGVAARLYYDFLREGVEIPYPIRTLHLHQRGDEQEQRDRERRTSRLAARFGAIDFLAPLGPEVLRELAGRLRTVAYGRGERIVSEGDEGADLFLLERGQVAVSVGHGAQVREIARIGPGDFFGEMSLMTGEARRATVVALGDVEAVRVDKDSFREVLARSPHVLDEIGRVLAARQAALDADAAAASAAAGQGIDQRSRALVSRIRGFLRL
jgi:small-conductance mechanosensitive channel/CRP-like cAMP-binding protein